LKGTYLYEQGTKDLNEARAKRYQKTAKSDQPKKGTCKAEQKEAPVHKQDVTALVSDPAVLTNDDGSVHHLHDGSFYKAFWLRFQANGELFQPLELLSIQFPMGAEQEKQREAGGSTSWFDVLPTVAIREVYVTVVCPVISARGPYGPGWVFYTRGSVRV
jgi:hypothetical protein